eukprot:9259857-Pyramimonas_sp.AAC.1
MAMPADLDATQPHPALVPPPIEVSDSSPEKDSTQWASLGASVAIEFGSQSADGASSTAPAPDAAAAAAAAGAAAEAAAAAAA